MFALHIDMNYAAFMQSFRLQFLHDCQDYNLFELFDRTEREMTSIAAVDQPYRRCGLRRESGSDIPCPCVRCRT